MIRCNLILSAVAGLFLAACSLTRPLERRQSRAGLGLPPRVERETRHKTAYRPNIQKVKSADGQDSLFLGDAVIDEQGNRTLLVNLEEVEVVAKSKVTVERFGKVVIDFQITVPRQLQSRCFGIVLTPRLHNNGHRTALEPLVIRGGLFSRVQDRDYWQYERFRARTLSYAWPDSSRWNGRLERAFHQLVRFPLTSDARLDSVAERPDRIVYYYSQEVPTEQTGRQVAVTLDGVVRALDGSRYELPPSDTMRYTISSMLSFVDTATRFLTRVVEKYAHVHDRAFVTFPSNSARIIDTLGNNRPELDKIRTLTRRLIQREDFVLDSLVLTASSSPEGSYARNEALARDRALALRDLLAELLSEGADTLITVRWVAENWTELARLIQTDTMPERKKLLAIIRETDDPDRREAEIRRRHPEAYQRLRAELYPRLRAVDFQFFLHRAGMVKDTLHTTEPDTLYQRGLRLLQERRYSKAMYYLTAYRDRNAAIALLSLGRDTLAWEILQALPSGAENDYLRAIAAARLHRTEQARAYLQKAVALLPTLKFRAELDPELTELLKR